jgi:hypothetical protein
VKVFEAVHGSARDEDGITWTAFHCLRSGDSIVLEFSLPRRGLTSATMRPSRRSGTQFVVVLSAKGHPAR